VVVAALKLQICRARDVDSARVEIAVADMRTHLPRSRVMRGRWTAGGMASMDRGLPDDELETLRGIVGAQVTTLAFGYMADFDLPPAWDPAGTCQVTWGLLLGTSSGARVSFGSRGDSSGDPYRIDCRSEARFRRIPRLAIQDVTTAAPWCSIVGRRIRDVGIQKYRSNYPDETAALHDVSWGIELLLEDDSLLVAAVDLETAFTCGEPLCHDEVVVSRSNDLIRRLKEAWNGKVSRWRRSAH
jgi:hypothetical protein